MNRTQPSVAAPDAPSERLRIAAQHVDAGRLAEAERLIEAVLAATPLDPEALHLLGLAAHRSGRNPRALDLVKKALAADDRRPVHWNTLGGIHRALGDLAAAGASFRRAVELAPAFYLAHSNLGLVLHAENKLADAESAFRRALALEPRYAPAAANLGAALLDIGLHEEAAEAFRRAVAGGIADRKIQILLARALMRGARYDEAAAALGKVIAVNAGDREARALLQECRFFSCDWTEFEQFAADFRQSAAAGARSLDYDQIFPASVAGVSRADQLALGRAAAARFARRAGPVPARGFRRAAKPKLTIGYLSGDFREHPVAHLTAELFELHERARFDVFGYSIGPDDGSPQRERLRRAFDRFVDLRASTIAAAADRIAADSVDVLVDLSGYTQAAAVQVLALRPAPIQVNFLGYPGTIGADFVDYIVADRFVLPPGHAADYAEAPAYLPDCYLPNDRKRVVPPAPPRAACGLPAEGFVFCCFNNVWKIAPAVFRLWMGLLRDVPGSVLWLRDFHPSATRNLRAEAERHGLAERLVFAARVDYPQHLARLGCADLFLDTLPYNAHATASDALWSGLPLLTCVGDTFAARVGGSALAAAGLPELITESLDAYRALALRLAREPGLLRALRQRLAAARLSCSLFDSARFAGALESLYARMWDRFAAGEKPATIEAAARSAARLQSLPNSDA